MKKKTLTPKGAAHVSEDFDDLVKLSFFTEMGKAITSAETLSEVFQAVMEHVGTVFAPSSWSLLLTDTKTDELEFKIATGKNSEKLKGTRIMKGEGIAGWIAETGQSLIVEDVNHDPRFSKRFDSLSGFETKSIIGVPLKTEKRVFGVIELINRLDGESFTPLDMKLLSTIADFAAIAIEKVYYFNMYKRMAILDGLTGVYNRRYFERVLTREIERATRYKHPLSLLMVDLDNFKRVNDKFGHLTGDKVLQSAAEILLQNIRTVDTVARYGGDEFAVLIPHAETASVEKIRSRIQQSNDAFNKLGKTVPFTMSIGLHTTNGENATDILAQTDIDLYREKDKKGEREFQSFQDSFHDFIDDEIQPFEE